MKSGLLLFAIVLLTAISARGEQRSFPTGDSGSSVSYIDAAGLGHPTDCTVSITSALPKLALSMNVFSSGKTSLLVATQGSLPSITPGSDATVKIGHVYIFSKVSKLQDFGSFHAFLMDPIEEPGSKPSEAIYRAIGEFVSGPTKVSVVADQADVGTAVVPPEPNLADAFQVCQEYMLAHWHP